jgi:ribosomal protein L30E
MSTIVMAKLISYFCLACSFTISAQTKNYNSKSAYQIPLEKSIFFGTIVFSNDKEAVAFKSEKAQIILLHGSIPKKVETKSFVIDYKLLTDMKSIPFSRDSSEILTVTQKDFTYYANNKNYHSKVYFLNVHSNEPRFFVYSENARKTKGGEKQTEKKKKNEK